MVQSGNMHQKIFEKRNSVLTDKLEIKEVRSIYHCCLAILISLFFCTAANDILHNGSAMFGLDLIFRGFRNFHLLLLIWTGMLLGSTIVYYGLKLWIVVRRQLIVNSSKHLWDRFWIGLLLLYYCCFMYYSTQALIKYDQPIASSFGLLCEMSRFLMKSHAFVRTNVPKFLKNNGHNQVTYPALAKFIYFYFAPTLVYQDHYPRVKENIRWNYVAVYILEVVAVLFQTSYLMQRFAIAPFEAFGMERYTWQDVIYITLTNAFPALLILIGPFYIIMHLCQNVFAELLQFADRLFYEDWWTSSNYTRYYRTWNIMVHEWLYLYIYKDFYNFIVPNKHAAKIMVFFVSAVFHEYGLAFAFRFFMPILFINFFGFGIVFSYINIKQQLVGNTFLWYTLALGMSINISAFSMEYFSRINCPIDNVDIVSYIIPRMFTCNKF